MKISACLAAAILGAGAVLLAGCATAPAEPGDLVYCDAGYGWWWSKGFGWRYVGFFGRGRPTGIALHRPPEHGEHPHPGEPGRVPPCYYFVQKGGRVLASDDGRAFHEAGTLVNGHFTPDVVPSGMPLDWYLARLDHDHDREPLGGGGAAARLAVRPASGFQRFVTNTAASFRGSLGSSRNSGPPRGGFFAGAGGGSGGSSSGGWSRSSGSYSGRGGSGGWSGGSRGGGGGGGGGGSRGGGGGGGGGRSGGGGGGGGGGHRDH